jgi:Uma2 family endonuclease
MIQVHKQKLTFEEYLSYEDSTDNRYELIDGELVTLPPESGLNAYIARYLLVAFISSGLVPLRLISVNACEIQVPVLKSGDAANRYPDLVILQEEHWDLTQNRLTVTLTMPPPRLAIEVVSPGKVGNERDYDPLRGLRQRKRDQYAARGIPEYWIVDPQKQAVTVLWLESGQYLEVGVFRDRTSILSPTFPLLCLTAEQALGGDV